MTLCNMAIEAGARSGMVAVDDTTIQYLQQRPMAPKAEDWDRAVSHWRSLKSDDAAHFDHVVRLDAAHIAPQVTWGTSPEMVVAVDGRVPDPDKEKDAVRREGAAATQQLESLGLVVQIGDPAFSEVVAEGQVVSWTVPASPTLVAGDTVLKGTTVVLTISGGKAPRKVPDLTGLSLAAATARLDALGLVIAQGEDVFSTDIPVGSVVVQDVAADSELAVGATVTVQLSKGPDLVAFPDLTDLDGETILKVLVQAGFKVGKVTGNGLLPLSYASIDGTLVNAGDQVPRGSTVDLFFETD